MARVSTKQITEQVKNIAELTEKINKEVESMPDCSAKKSYQNSVSNLEKKNEQFGKEREKLSDEEKEVMKKALNEFRSQKKNDEVSTKSETGRDESVPEISESGMGKKKGRKN